MLSYPLNWGCQRTIFHAKPRGTTQTVTIESWNSNAICYNLHFSMGYSCTKIPEESTQQQRKALQELICIKISGSYTTKGRMSVLLCFMRSESIRIEILNSFASKRKQTEQWSKIPSSWLQSLFTISRRWCHSLEIAVHPVSSRAHHFPST